MSYAVADVLDNAADYIETYGWCQHVARDDHGRVCLEGALTTVGGTGQIAYRAYEAVRIRLAMQADGLVVWAYSPHVWNDEPDRTVQEVLDLLRATAKDQRAVSDRADACPAGLLVSPEAG